MSNTWTTRRHPDGSIDFDFYRADAADLRRKAIRDFGTPRRLRRASMSALAVAGFLAAALLLVTAPRQEISVATGLPAHSDN